jgi:hypothetical protein
MFEFIAGVAVGAAFSPFWMMVGKFIASKITTKVEEETTKK